MISDLQIVESQQAENKVDLFQGAKDQLVEDNNTFTQLWHRLPSEK